MRISGNPLPEDSMYVTLNGDGQWSALPCLFDKTTPLSEALADYYQNATPGDLIKARNRFATFTEDKRWEGNLTALRPGEGYFFRRVAPGNVDIAFHNRPNSANSPAAKRSVSANGLLGETGLYSNPNASTNMTMIAKLSNDLMLNDQMVNVYVGDELVAVAKPVKIANDQSPMTNNEVLYFITIQSEQLGQLRFELDGETLTAKWPDRNNSLSTRQSDNAVVYTPNAHYGSVKDPIILCPADGTGIYKIIENQQVVIIRNNEKYDVTGKKF